MLRTMLKSNIHRATVTQADLLPGELVAIVDITNGARLETYVITGERGSGVLGINGAAAHLVHPGDLVILIAYGLMDNAEAAAYQPRVIFVDADNKVLEQGSDPGHAPAGSGLMSGNGPADDAEQAEETADATQLDALLRAGN